MGVTVQVPGLGPTVPFPTTIQATSTTALVVQDASATVQFQVDTSTPGVIVNVGPLLIGGTARTGLGDGGSPKVVELLGGAGYALLEMATSNTASTNTTGAITFGTTGASTLKRSAQIISNLRGASGTNAVGDLEFYTANGSDTVEAMRIHASRGVSIGNTTDPGQANLGLTGKFTTYNAVATVGLGTSATYGLDNRTGLTGADGAAITLYTAPGANGLYRVTADIFATAAVTGTATYTLAWTENGTGQTLATTATAINVLGTVTALIRPDSGTIITSRLTGAFTGTFTVGGLVEQLA